jgi:hypothetical protein
MVSPEFTKTGFVTTATRPVLDQMHSDGSASYYQGVRWKAHHGLA